VTQKQYFTWKGGVLQGESAARIARDSVAAPAGGAVGEYSRKERQKERQHQQPQKRRAHLSHPFGAGAKPQSRKGKKKQPKQG